MFQAQCQNLTPNPHLNLNPTPPDYIRPLPIRDVLAAAKEE